jgi:hypothetical protein
MRRAGGFIAVALALAAIGTACSGQTGTKESGLRVGSMAPSFSLPSTTGGSVSLSEFRGRKPVLLYFSMGPG